MLREAQVRGLQGVYLGAVLTLTHHRPAKTVQYDHSLRVNVVLQGAHTTSSQVGSTHVIHASFSPPTYVPLHGYCNMSSLLLLCTCGNA